MAENLIVGTKGINKHLNTKIHVESKFKREHTPQFEF